MARIAPLRSAAGLLFVFAVSSSAHAQDRVTPGDDVPGSAAPQRPAITTHVETDASVSVQKTERRPSALIPLYASFVALEALDVHSTSRALANGAVEANPAMSGLTGSSVGVVAAKDEAAGRSAELQHRGQHAHRDCAVGQRKCWRASPSTECRLAPR